MHIEMRLLFWVRFFSINYLMCFTKPV